MIASKDELFSKLLKKTRELGRKVTFSEVENDPEMPRANAYAVHFGSFTNATEEAFYKYQREINQGHQATNKLKIKVKLKGE